MYHKESIINTCIIDVPSCRCDGRAAYNTLMSSALVRSCTKQLGRGAGGSTRSRCYKLITTGTSAQANREACFAPLTSAAPQSLEIHDPLRVTPNNRKYK